MTPPMREPRMVPDAKPDSYYGRPILKPPVWKQPDVPLYLFLGGLAGASAVLAEGAAFTGRPGLTRVARMTAAAGSGLGTVALVHDLGRPERFLNMLRVFKPTSPLSVGSWILAPFATLAAGAALSEVTGRLPLVGRLAGGGAAVLGPPLATYTAALICNTAVPAWHEGYREMPFLFAGSAAAAAAGVALVGAPGVEVEPARRLAVAGAALELTAAEMMKRRLGMVAEPYEQGRPGALMKASQILSIGSVLTAVLGRRSRTASAIAGAGLTMASVLTRFGVFQAGLASSKDPKYVVTPQRERLRQRTLSR
jgi:formate-dependent nitrite reductase membrane component NrfD